MSGTDLPPASGASEGAGAAPSPGERRGRRRRGRLLAWLGAPLVLVALCIAGLWAYLERSGVLSERALAYANSYLARAGNLRLSARRLERTTTGIRLVDPLLEIGDRGRWYPSLRGRRAEIGVRPLALLFGRAQVFELRLDQPTIALYYAADGRAVLPAFRSPGGKGRPPRDGFLVDLERARFVVHGPSDSTEVWSGGRLRAGLTPARGGYDILLERAGGSLPPLGLRVGEGRGRGWTGKDSLGWSALSFVTDAGTIRLTGGWRGGKLDVDFHAQNWPWEFFGDLLEQPALDVAGGVAVRGHVSGTTDRPAFRGGVEGKWREEPFRGSLAGEWGREGLALSSARLEWRRASLAGSARFPKTGTWWLQGRLSGLDLSQVGRLWPGRELPATDLGGPVRLEGGRARLAIRADGVGGLVGGVGVEGVRGAWRLEGRRQEIEVSGGVAGGIVRGAGTLRGGALDLAGSVAGLDLGLLAAADRRLRGTAGTVRQGTVRLAGSLERPKIVARCAVDEPGFRQLRARRAEAVAEGWLGTGGPLNLEVRAANLVAGAWHADSAVARAVYEGRGYRVAELRASSPDSLLAAAFTVTPVGEGWRVEASHLWVQAGDWWVEAVTPVVFTVDHGRALVESARLSGNLGRVDLSGQFAGAEDMDVSLEAEGVDLRVAGAAVRAPDLAGDLSLKAHLRAGGGWRHLDLDFKSGEFLAPHVRIKDLAGSVALRAGQGELTIESVRLSAGAGSLSGSGQARLAGATWPLAPADWPQGLRRAREWRGELRASDFDLALLAGLWPRAQGLTGRWTGSARLGGNPEDPEGETQGVIRGLAFAGYRLDSAEWLATYRGKTLTVEKVDLAQGPLKSAISGTLPLDLAWETAHDRRLPERPMDLRLHVPDGDLGVLPLFLPVVAAAEGRVAGEVRLTGTPAHPHASGSARVRDGRLRFTGREEVYRDVQAELRLNGDRVLVDEITARQGRAGLLRGSGVVTLGGGRVEGYDLKLSAERASALASGEYSFLFDGNFQVTTGPRLGNSLFPLPHVQGKLEVLQGVLLYDFSDPKNRVYFEGPEQGPAWIYDIDLQAPRRVYWRTPSANIEMKADLTVSRTLDAFRVWGTVEAVRGDYYFLENKFRVQSGTLSFDEVESLNPKIDAKAQTTVNLAPPAGGAQGEVVTIELADRLRKPKVSLYSSSGLSETYIIRLLTYGRFGLDSRNADPLASEKQRIVVGTMGGQYLVRQLAREFPEASSLLSDVELSTAVVNTGSGGRVVPRVGVTRYLTSELLLRYSQLLGGGQPEGYSFDFRDVGAEYRISKIFYLTGEVVERRTGSVLTPGTSASELDYNVDLRARHEW